MHYGSVCPSMMIYLLLALDLPPRALKAIDKIRRGFLWKGRKEVRGGHRLVAWPMVAWPCFPILSFWVGLLGWDDYGCRRLNLARHGHSFQSKLNIKSKLSLLLQWCLLLGMARMSSSGLTGGWLGKAWSTLSHTCFELWLPGVKEEQFLMHWTIGDGSRI